MQPVCTPLSRQVNRFVMWLSVIHCSVQITFGVCVGGGGGGLKAQVVIIKKKKKIKGKKKKKSVKYFPVCILSSIVKTGQPQLSVLRLSPLSSTAVYSSHLTWLCTVRTGQPQLRVMRLSSLTPTAFYRPHILRGRVQSE